MNSNCSSPLRWNPFALAAQQPSLYVCIIAIIIHSIFWIQLIFFSSIRQRSLQWIYAYLISDILLLTRFFFIYIVRTRSTDCNPARLWYLVVCYIDSFVDNYLNVLEVYILFALNICRYVQIAYNQNVYIQYVKSLVVTHLSIYLLPLTFLISQFFFGWSRVVDLPYNSCDVDFTNIYAQTINILIALVFPIGLNVGLIVASVRYVHLTARLRRTDQRNQLTAREKYNRSLVIQFLVFYIVWLVLWSPNIIAYQVTNGQTQLTTNMRLLNYIEITLDPFIIAALDVRFWHAWRRIGKKIRLIFLTMGPKKRRVQPVTNN